MPEVYLTDRLQTVLRAAAGLVLQLLYRSSVTDLMHRKLHWLDVQSRVRFKIGLLVYKSLHGLAPRYPLRVLRAGANIVHSPNTAFSLALGASSYRPSNEYEDSGPRGFFHASSAFWDLLPDDLRDPELFIGSFRNNQQIENFHFSQI